MELLGEVEGFAKAVIGRGKEVVGQMRRRRALAAVSSIVPKLTNNEKSIIVEQISKWFECSFRHQLNEMCEYDDCTYLLKESQARSGSCEK